MISALWGAVRPGDRIPPYRLNMCGRLPGLDHLTDVWRGPLAEALPAAVRRGVVVDCRSAEYASVWRPKGALAERTVLVKVVRERDGTRGAVSHNAKHTRGLVARRIVTDTMDPRRPDGLAEALSVHFEVDLRPADRPGRLGSCTWSSPRSGADGDDPFCGLAAATWICPRVARGEAGRAKRSSACAEPCRLAGCRYRFPRHRARRSAGTTWLGSNLRCHPELYVTRPQNHFFDEHFDDKASRRTAGTSTRPGRVEGEITPAYSVLSEERVRFVRDVMPEVRLLFVMRNPIERACGRRR